ncbi:MAG: tetratricopeptide (TPR) repeat protein [Myxococcota bacterium]|jgi:tetratricopeptide (TPR) repeat protein
MSASWSGIGFLEQIDGSIEEFPPIRVLFALYRLNASGRLTIQHETTNLELTLSAGKVVGVHGAPELLSAIGVSGAADADLMGLVGAAIAGGQTPDDALLAAANGLGDLLVSGIGQTGGRVRFEDGLKARGAAIPLPRAIPRIIREALARSRGAVLLEAAFTEQLPHEVRLSLPSDAPAERWGLTPVALRLLRIVEKNIKRRPTLQQVLRKDPAERMVAADLLLQLGLLSLHEPPPRPKRRAPESPPVTAAPEPTAPAPPDSLELLTQELARLRTQQPWEILDLKLSKNITDEGIDRANRTTSRKYHPDQFSSESDPVRAMAAECFGVLQGAYETMQRTSLRTEVIARLEAAERGEQYVTDRDRSEAELLYTRGQVLFRKKDYAAALESFDHAFRLDSGKWRHAYMARRAGYHAGVLPGSEAAQLILSLDGPRGLTRADVLFEVAEILIREDGEKQAHDLYQQVLQLNPAHIGARRRTRIRKMRASAAEEESSTGLFSGLFRRKKK